MIVLGFKLVVVVLLLLVGVMVVAVLVVAVLVVVLVVLVSPLSPAPALAPAPAPAPARDEYGEPHTIKVKTKKHSFRSRSLHQDYTHSTAQSTKHKLYQIHDSMFSCKSTRLVL